MLNDVQLHEFILEKENLASEKCAVYYQGIRYEMPKYVFEKTLINNESLRGYKFVTSDSNRYVIVPVLAKSGVYVIQKTKKGVPMTARISFERDAYWLNNKQNWERGQLALGDFIHRHADSEFTFIRPIYEDEFPSYE